MCTWLMNAPERCWLDSSPRIRWPTPGGVRRPLEPVATGRSLQCTAGLAPLLAKLLSQQAATGLPPPYLPMEDISLTVTPKNESEVT